MTKNGSASKIRIDSFDDLFGSTEIEKSNSTEQVVEVSLEELHTFKNHPFRVLDDAKMEETVESIKKYGVLMPGIARPRKEGGYEIIVGHRRKRGSELAGKTTMPVFIRNYTDDEATIIMVDIHNHILFCAADHINYDKYHDCKKTYYRIRNLSDELCREHQLSVIEAGEKRGEKYIEWQAEKTDTSWKSAIRKDINATIKSSATYEEFLQILKAKGYEIKGESLEDSSPKYISFRPADKERFVRGSAKSLGKEYTKERIKERIESGLERNFKVLPKERISKGLIDMEQEKIKERPVLKRWAAVENLKNIAESYNDAGSIMELEQKLSDISNECKL